MWFKGTTVVGAGEESLSVPESQETHRNDGFPNSERLLTIQQVVQIVTTVF